MWSSTAPFGSQQQSVFGQNNNTTSNLFGTTAPFGSQTGGSIFGGNSIGGTQASLPFGQKPAFGFQQTQSAFGSSPGFGATNTPAFGAPTTSALGAAATTPAFGFQQTAATTQAFGSQPTPAFSFGSQPTSTLGSGGGFGTPGFGFTSNPAFGTTTALGTSTASSFGAQPATSTAFSQTNSGFGSSPFGSTSSAFGTQSSSFGTQTTTPSTFGFPSTFGQPGFNSGQQQRGGSRLVAYIPTTFEESVAQGTAKFKLQSISTMPVYENKSHEELKWDDYQLGDKGGTIPAAQPSSIGTPTPPPNHFASTQTNPFSSTATANPFGQKTTGFPSSTSGFNPSGIGGSTTLNPFGTGSLASTSVFAQPSIPSSPSNFGTTPTSTPSTSTSSFNPFGTPPSTTTSPFYPTPGTTNTLGLTIGTTPTFQQTSNALGQISSSAFAPISTTSSYAPLSGTQNSGFLNNYFNSTPSQPSSSNTFLAQTNPSQQTQSAFSFHNICQQQQPNSGFLNNYFNSAPSQPSSSNTFLAQTNPSQQTQSAFSSPNIGQQQQPAASSGGFNISTGIGVTSSVFNSVPISFNSANTAATQPAVVATNPFGTLPTMPQISMGHTRFAPSIQYGISKMPVIDKPAPVRVSSLLMTSRHLSQRRMRLPARSSYPNNGGARVPFFSDDEEAPTTPKADALFIPRENPRTLVIHPVQHWTSRTSAEKSKDTNNTPLHENGKLSEKDSGSSLNGSINHEKHKSNPSFVENGHNKERTDIEASIVYEHEEDIEALMPKLCYSDYYTEPRIQELAAKEKAVPGFCCKVKDFVVGRHGFGSIKFAGETDVRKLDLDSLVQFNNREVIVYLDENNKPPVGQGLNKAAVVTLLNIKCFDKKTGQQYIEGVKAEKYKEMLMKKARDQGADFVSYDPIKGEWKFRVNHF
ncbi:hypothetical protein MKX01_000506 [Papaver californicum]|nr:hypothetical protein MKX01_000506 [Papaver californicum]